MAEDLTHLQASRKAYKSHVTRLFHKIDSSLDTEVDDYTITTLRTAIEQLNSKKTKITELDVRIAAVITDSEELTEAMTEAGELEDSITDKIARVLRFIELQTLGKTPPPSPVSHASLISRPTVASTELPLSLSSTVEPTSISSTLALESSSDITPHSSASASIDTISSIVSSMPTVGTVTTVPLISTPLLSSMMPATTMYP